MATPAATLSILVNAQTRSATSSLRSLDTSTRRSATHLQNLDRTSGRLSQTLGRVGRAAAAAASGYVGISLAQNAISATTDLAKVTLSLNQNLGLATKTSIELGAQLKVRGADAKQSAQAFATFAGVLHGAADGSSSAIQKLAELGITGKKLKTDLADPNKALFDVSDGLKNLGAGFARTDIQRKLFGRGWQALSPLIRGGSKDLKDQLAIAKPVSDAFGKDGVKGIHDYINAQREMQIEMLALQVSFAKNVAPTLITIFKLFGTVTNYLRDHLIPAVKNFIEEGNHGKDFVKGFMVIPKALIFIGKAIIDGVKNWITIFKGAVFGIKRAWANLGDILVAPFAWAYGKITDFINKIIDVINVIPGVNIGHVGGGGGAQAPKGTSGPIGPTSAGGNKAPKGVSGPTKQRGGFAGLVPGSGSGDKVGVQALVEPGEGLFVMNRNAMGGLMAMNQAMPRFALGGIPGAIGGAVGGAAGKIAGAAGGLIGKVVGKFPNPADLGWASGVGSYAISKAKDFIASKLSSPFTGSRGGGGSASWGGVPIASWIAPELKWAQGKGWSGSVTSGYRSFAEQAILYARYLAGGPLAAAPGSSEHEQLAYPGGAVDVTDFMTLAGLVGKYPGAQKLKWFGSGDPVHFSGTGHQRGGAVPGPKHGSHWIKGGPTWSVDEAATLLWQAGLDPSTAAQLARVVPGESGGNPRAHNASGATGLFQILGALVPGNLYDPRINALNAVAKYRSQGFGAWEAARSGPAGRILRSAVGKSGGTTGSPMFGFDPGKAPKLGPGGSFGFNGADLSGWASSMNELRGAGNLSALQGYNVGSAQNPMLGISSPGYPSLAPVVIVVEDGAVDATRIKRLSGKEAQKHTRKASRKGNRKLPSAKFG